MRKIATWSGGLLGFIIILAVTVYWFEAEKEVRILCSMFQEGQTADSVTRTLDTGNLLYYSQAENIISVNSRYTLNTTSCSVDISNDTLVSDAQYSQLFRLELVSGGLATILTLGLVFFHILLAIGVPWGEWAWGGAYKRLPMAFRIGSILSALVLIFGGLSVLSTIGLLSLIPAHISDIVVYVLTILFLVSIVGNVNSKSLKERQVMVPLSMVFAVTYLIVSVYSLGN